MFEDMLNPWINLWTFGFQENSFAKDLSPDWTFYNGQFLQNNLRIGSYVTTQHLSVNQKYLDLVILNQFRG